MIGKRGWPVVNVMVRTQSTGELFCYAVVLENVHSWSHHRVLMLTMLPVHEVSMRSQDMLEQGKDCQTYCYIYSVALVCHDIGSSQQACANALMLKRRQD